MGSVMAAIAAMKTWGRIPQPHIHSHFDCECSNDSSSSSSSSEEAVRNNRQSTTWLQRHRPFPEKVLSTTPAHDRAKGKDRKRDHYST